MCTYSLVSLCPPASPHAWLPLILSSYREQLSQNIFTLNDRGGGDGRDFIVLGQEMVTSGGKPEGVATTWDHY